MYQPPWRRKIAYQIACAFAFVLLSGCSEPTPPEKKNEIFKTTIEAYGYRTESMSIEIPSEYVDDFRTFRDGSVSLWIKMYLDSLRPVQSHHIINDDDVINIAMSNIVFKSTNKRPNEKLRSRMTLLRRLNNGLEEYEWIGTKRYFFPVNWSSTSVIGISCSVRCSADHSYKGFNISFSFSQIYLDRWREIEQVVILFLDQHTKTAEAPKSPQRTKANIE